MANASPRDTRAGFDIFRQAGGDITLADLNQKLLDAGYGPVADRSIKHYRSLLTAGYGRYISINRFDIARASAPYDDASSNPRYRYTDVDTGVLMVIAKGSKLYEAAGRATALGETGAIVRIIDAEYTQGLASLKARAGDMVSLRFPESGRSVHGRLVELDLASDPALLEVDYTGLVSLAELEVGLPMPVLRASYRLGGAEDEELTIDVLGRRIYEFFEIVEEARALVNRVASGAGTSAPNYAPPIVLESLRVASPAEFVVSLTGLVQHLLPVGLLTAVIRGAALFIDKRKVWHEGTGVALDNRAKLAETELKELQVEQARAEAELIKAAADSLTREFPAADRSEIEQTVRLRIIPPLRSLGESGVESITELDEEDEG